MTSQPDPKLKAENSLSVRMSSLIMSLLSISLGCHYVKAPVWLSFLYIFTCLLGSFFAYYFRKKGNRWITILAVLGTILVMANFGQEVFFQFYVGRLNPIAPFVTVLSGLLALHTLDLRTRIDINTAALIGLGLMACIGMIAHDIVFGLAVVTYLLLGAMLLYFQCISSSLAGVLKKGKNEASSLSISQASPRRTMGSNVCAIFSLPIFAILLFFNLPRIDSLIDRLVAELAQNGFPFRIMLVGTQDAASTDGATGGAGGRNSNLLADYGDSQKGPAKSGDSSGGKAASAKSDRNQSAATAYNLGNLGIGGTFGPSPSGEDALSYTRFDPTKQDEVMLLWGDKNAKAEDNTVLFTMTSSREVFLKRLVFDYFDGQAWKVKDKDLLLTVDMSPNSLVSLATVPSLKKPLGGTVEVSQEITAKADLGHIIPAATVPQRIEFPAEQIFVDKHGALRSAVGIAAGTKFQVVSKTPLFNPRHLELNTPTIDEEDVVRKALAHDLQLPPDLGSETGYLANAVVGRERNWYSQAQRLCDYLRANFRYSLNAPKGPPSENMVRNFLLVSKEGDCTYFASTFVMLCRSLGIPSRCVGGFSPGTRNFVSGLTEVRWRNSHAWAEVFIPRFGWVPFDPVPGGYLPAERPTPNLLASLAKSPLARSLETVVDSVAKAKGLRRADDEIGNEGNIVSGAGKSGTSSQPGHDGKPATSQTTGRAPLAAINSGSADSYDKPLLRIDGVSIGRAQPKENGFMSKAFHFFDQAQTVDLTWMAGYWRQAALAVALIIVGSLAFRLLRDNYKLFSGPQKRGKKATVQHSTLSFMRVMKDLGRLKVKREKGETADEVVAKVLKRLSEIERPRWRELLPGLLTNFMGLYCLNRFAPAESAIHTAKLLEIEKEIHSLLTSS